MLPFVSSIKVVYLNNADARYSTRSDRYKLPRSPAYPLVHPLTSMKGSTRDEPRYGLYMPNFGKAAHPQILAKLADEAEKSGWDGFFLWDHLVEWNERVPIYETFTSLAAVATNTNRIRIGTTVTPLPKSKPWIVARQTVALDHLSNGRLTIGVGLGAEESTDYDRFGEVADNRVLGEKLDEALSIIAGLWTGKPFSHNGKHFRVKKTVFLPSPLQKPRIPIWVGGFWPRKGPFRRAAKWDGAIPLRTPGDLPQPEDIRQVIDYVNNHRRSRAHFDVANIGWTSGVDRKKDREKISPYLEAGTTWWLESLYTKQDSREKMRERIRKGPPG
ncbi:LLM class flavin-dependent oxidoreductase [Candidatus Bathyarchaeota archaeon]|nr:MAG: LLM class flavin-dependent oxidoreductase [Candidatus Bathyarchaeota archaeon]